MSYSPMLAVWKEIGAKRQVDTLILGTSQPEALELVAEAVL